MVRKFIFRVYGPPETIIVPVDYDPLMLPGKVENAARKYAQRCYVKKHHEPTAELIKYEDEHILVTSAAIPKNRFN